MAWTYATLTAAIQSYLEDEGTEFVSNIPEIIRQAETRILYAVPGLPEYMDVSTGNLGIGNPLLATPANFMSVQTMEVNDGTSTQALIVKDQSFLREAYPTSATGVPLYYAMYDAIQIMLAPTPDVAYAYNLYYFGAPTSIVDNTTSWLGTNAEDALLYGCLVEAYTYLKGETDVWQAYKLRYDEAIAGLKNYADAIATRDSFRPGDIRAEPR